MRILSLLFFPCLFILSACALTPCELSDLKNETEGTFIATIYVKNSAGDPVSGYPVRFYLQKTFCDGDVGFPIDESAVTNEDGWVNSTGWTIPYINKEDYVTVTLFAGPEGN